MLYERGLAPTLVNQLAVAQLLGRLGAKKAAVYNVIHSPLLTHTANPTGSLYHSVVV